MNIAITGASGHLGAAVLQELFRKGHSVKALIRDNDTRSCEGLPVKIVNGDLQNENALQELMSHCDALIHCAAYISVNGDPRGLVHHTNVTGTNNVMKAAKWSGIKRVIHTSSIHAFNQRPTYELLDEKRETINEKHFPTTIQKSRGSKLHCP